MLFPLKYWLWASSYLATGSYFNTGAGSQQNQKTSQIHRQSNLITNILLSRKKSSRLKYHWLGNILNSTWLNGILSLSFSHRDHKSFLWPGEEGREKSVVFTPQYWLLSGCKCQTNDVKLLGSQRDISPSSISAIFLYRAWPLCLKNKKCCEASGVTGYYDNQLHPE